MKDLQREIINQVASGKITAEEGAARLESLHAAESGAEPAQAASAPTATAAAPAGTRRVRVNSVIGMAEIVGDPSVTVAVAEGPHRARQDGDTIVIEQEGLLGENDSFSFVRGDRKAFVNAMDVGRRRLRVRMNPALALTAQVNAGSLRVEGVHGPITAEVLAGSLRISDFAAPLEISTQAGNVSASGRLDSGASRVRCEMGNVTINLERGSSVQVTARTTMGKVAVDSGGDAVVLGQSGQAVTIGSGAGRLDIDCAMGNVRVTA